MCVSMCAYVCACPCARVCMWSPEVNLACCSSDAVYIAFEIESPTVPLLT